MNQSSHVSIEQAVSQGIDAFWAVVARNFPGITAGDVSPDRSFELYDAAFAAVAEWAASER